VRTMQMKTLSMLVYRRLYMAFLKRQAPLEASILEEAYVVANRKAAHTVANPIVYKRGAHLCAVRAQRSRALIERVTLSLTAKSENDDVVLCL
jgi:hypothetical protein